VRWALAVSLLCLAGCDAEPAGEDAGAAIVDAGALDAGDRDGGDRDAGDGDAGDGDAGVDAGAWVELFNGEDLTGIALHVTTPDEITIADGAITCGTGPNGYWYTEASYADYVLELQFRYARPPDLAPGDDASFAGNSGYLMHIQEPHRVWPACVEVQGMNRDVGQIFSIGGAAPVTAREDDAARQAALEPVGEWNDLRIESDAGAFRVELNGVEVADSDPGPLRSGPIGFQCEMAEISWRSVRLMPRP